MKASTSLDIEGVPLVRGNLFAGSLPDGYIDQTISAIRDTANVVPFELGVTPNNLDFDHVGEFLMTVVAAGEDIAPRMPWFEEYYKGELRDISSNALGEEAICLNSINEILMGLAFAPGLRIEAHTDIWAINANLYLKTSTRKTDPAPQLSGATIVGRKGARSHSDILANPLAIVRGEVGKLTILAANEYPHTIGVPDQPSNYEYPDITSDTFWEDPETRISLNISYTTARQLEHQPTLRPMTAEVGYSIPVLGRNRTRSSAPKGSI